MTLLATPASKHRHFAVTTSLHGTANAFLLVLPGHFLPLVFASPVTQIVLLVQAEVHSTNAHLVLQVDQSSLLDDINLRQEPVLR